MFHDISAAKDRITLDIMKHVYLSLFNFWHSIIHKIVKSF